MKKSYLLVLLSIFLNSTFYAQTCPPNENAPPLQILLPTSVYCLEEVVPFEANVSAENYQWDFGEGSIIEEQDSLFFFLYTQAGDYTVKLRVDYGNGCLDSATIDVSILTNTADFTFTVDSNTVHFQADTSELISTYFWDFGNGSTGSGSSVIEEYRSFGEYAVTLQTTGVCAPDSITKIITIAPPSSPEDNPTACNDGVDNDGDGDIDCDDSECNFSYTTDFTFEIDEDSVTFQADTSPYINTYFWDFGNGITGSGSSVSAQYDTTGEYIVTLTNEGICISDSITKTITIASPLSPEDNPTACNDGIDNDGDGAIDCQDSDCLCDKDNDGTFAHEDPDDNDPCVPDNTVSVCDTTTSNNTQIFTDFPWLNELVDTNNCNNEKISVYALGSFSFVYIETEENSILYFQNGQRYCKSTPTFDCLSPYNFGTPVAVWACITDPTLIDEDEDGTSSDIDPDDNNPCVPDSTVANCGLTTPQIFLDFPWLLDLVDPTDCTNEKISVYPIGPYFFVYVETASSSILYFQNGQRYCRSRRNRSCIAAYGLSNPTSVWTCANSNRVDEDEDGTFSDVDPDDNDPCVPDNTVANCEINNPQVFTDFPWLLDLVDPNNCSDVKISVYPIRSFFFVYVETKNSGILYFQTGQRYCRSRRNYDCLAAYGFSNPSSVWTCNDSYKAEVNEHRKSILYAAAASMDDFDASFFEQLQLDKTPNRIISTKEFDFKAFPNPTTNNLTIELESPINQSLQLILIDRDGRMLIDEQQTIQKGFNRIPISLYSLNSGLYYLVIKNPENGFSVTERIAVIKE